MTGDDISSLFPHLPRPGADGAGLGRRHRRLRCHRRGLPAGPRRPRRPRARRDRREAAAAVLDLGDHQLPDPGRAQHFRRVLRQNPDLPQGRSETEGGANWFTLDEVLRLRAHFGAEGSKAKEYLPYRPAGLPAKIVAVANFKGGVGKTSTCAHLAMSAALDGYKVLVVDLDSQGSDDLDLRRPDRGRMGHRLPAPRAPLRRAAARREPAPGGPRRGAAAARRGADRGAEDAAPPTSSARPTGPTST